MNSKTLVASIALTLSTTFCGADYIKTFSGALPKINAPSQRIDYKIDLQNEPYVIHVPAGYDGTKPFGLIVFIPATGNIQAVPKDWEKVLADKRLLFVCPQKAENSCETSRRMGLAVMGALKMQELYKIDPQRVYAAGISGGARIASDLGFYQADIFHATIQSCGSNFPREVPRVLAVPLARDKGERYGLSQATDAEWKNAREKVRFVIATGPGDFRHANLLDIFEGGFKKEGFKAMLFDVPGMKHEICNGTTLLQALDFIEQGH